MTVDFPIGHRRRRTEGIPILLEKFEAAVAGRLSPARAGEVVASAKTPARLDSMAIHRVLDSFSLAG